MEHCREFDRLIHNLSIKTKYGSDYFYSLFVLVYYKMCLFVIYFFTSLALSCQIVVRLLSYPDIFRLFYILFQKMKWFFTGSYDFFLLFYGSRMQICLQTLSSLRHMSFECLLGIVCCFLASGTFLVLGV